MLVVLLVLVLVLVQPPLSWRARAWPKFRVVWRASDFSSAVISTDDIGLATNRLYCKRCRASFIAKIQPELEHEG